MTAALNWPTHTVDELCLSIVDCVNRTAPIVEGPTPYRMIRTTNVRDGFVDLRETRSVDEATFKVWTRRQLPQPGDVILTREAPLGEVGLLRGGSLAFLGQRLVSYRVDPNLLDNRYLVYYLRSGAGRAQVLSLGSGSTVHHMRVPEAKRLRIPTPPIDEQRRIGAILGAYDDLIEVNRKRIALLEIMARDVFEEWFSRFRYPGHRAASISKTPEGLLPNGWRWGVLGDLVELRRDITGPGSHLLGRAYVPIECIGKRTLTLAEVRTWEEAQSSLQLFERDDILFGAMRAYFHKVAPAPMAGVTRSTCFVLRARGSHLWSYSLLTLFRDETVGYASTHSKGSTIPYAQWKGSLEKLIVPLPLEATLMNFERLVRPNLQSIMSMQRSNHVLATCRDLLLPRLLSGQLSVAAAERQLEDAA